MVAKKSARFFQIKHTNVHQIWWNLKLRGMFNRQNNSSNIKVLFILHFFSSSLWFRFFSLHQIKHFKWFHCFTTNSFFQKWFKKVKSFFYLKITFELNLRDNNFSSNITFKKNFTLKSKTSSVNGHFSRIESPTSQFKILCSFYHDEIRLRDCLSNYPEQ